MKVIILIFLISGSINGFLMVNLVMSYEEEFLNLRANMKRILFGQ